MTAKSLSIIISVYALLNSFTLATDTIPSAAEALDKVLNPHQPTQAQPGKKYATIYQQLKQTKQLPQQEQVTFWINQFKNLNSAQRDSQNFWVYQEVIKMEMLRLLPTPDSWEDLSKELTKLAEQKDFSQDVKKSLTLLATLFNANQQNFVKELYASPSKKKTPQSLLSKILWGSTDNTSYDRFQYVKNTYAANFTDATARLAQFKATLEQVDHKIQSGQYVDLTVPPLVQYYGEDIANPLLEKVADIMTTKREINSNRINLDLPQDKETLTALAALLKKKNKEIYVYSSVLMESVRDPQLLAKVNTHSKAMSRYDKQAFYKLNFAIELAQGNKEKAQLALEKWLTSQIKTDLKLPKDVLMSTLAVRSGNKLYLPIHLNRAEKQKAFETLIQLLDNPNNGILWSLTNQFALELGETQRVLQLFSKKFPATQPDNLQEARAASQIARTYLALNAIQKGRELRNSVIGFYERELTTKQEKHLEQGTWVFLLEELTALYLAEAKVAEALQEKNVAKHLYLKVVNIPKQIHLQQAKQGAQIFTQLQSDFLAAASALIDLGALETAQTTLVHLLELHNTFDTEDADNDYYSSQRRQRIGEALVKLYRASNQPGDIIWLMQHFPYWEQRKLHDLTDQQLLINVAWALRETGQNDQAFAILAEKISDGTLVNDDSAYRLLLSLKHPNTSSFLDLLTKQYPFQERPLIWKAQIAIDKGNYKDAETLARKGITIDPSDGEQGKDDRMQVYAVLAKTLARQGKQKEADFFHNVVTAIRMGEQADTLFYAGLIQRALDAYNRSLDYFADAYCLQSRLAVYYANMGDTKKAERYYQRAFELMPSSFGRIESHCFGCEGAFHGETAQTIAERTFKKIIKEQPDLPQTYYLMGYLEDSKNRYDKAITYYQQAVALDPKYINAWSKIIASEAKPTKELLKLKQKAVLTLLTLNPRRRTSSQDALLSFQLRKAYAILKEASLSEKTFKGIHFPLTASAKHLEKKYETHSNGRINRQEKQALRAFLNQTTQPMSAVWQDALINNLFDICMPPKK